MVFNKFSNINNDEFIDIDNENIIMEFEFENNLYCVIEDPNKGNINEAAIYFAKEEFDEQGNEILKRIPEEDYDKVVNFYDKLLKDMEEIYE